MCNQQTQSASTFVNRTDSISETHFKGSNEKTEKTKPELTCLRRVRERVCARRGGGIRGMLSESDKL